VEPSFFTYFQGAFHYNKSPYLDIFNLKSYIYSMIAFTDCHMKEICYSVLLLNLHDVHLHRNL
jgi:hypothetical protein